MIRLRLDYRAPLAWTDLLAFLSARAIPGVERVDGECYSRTFAAGAQGRGVAGWIEVRPSTKRSASLEARVSLSLAPRLAEIAARLRALFDLDARPDRITAALADDPLLSPSLRARPGLRVPGAFDPFEVAIRAVLGQQVSVRGATTLSGRLVERFGLRATSAGGAPLPEGLDHLFPSPARLAALSVDELRTIGLPAARASTLRALSHAVATGHLRIDGLDGDPESVLAALQSIPGIGPWTAHYLALRALRWPDAFPAGDLVLRRALGGVDLREAESRASRWRPFRAYAAMHLWSQQ